MEELTAIWSDVDQLLKKPIMIKSVDNNLCIDCNHVKIITKEGLPTCPNCGLVDDMCLGTARRRRGLASPPPGLLLVF